MEFIVKVIQTTQLGLPCKVKAIGLGLILAEVCGFESLISNTWVTVITKKVYASYRKI